MIQPRPAGAIRPDPGSSPIRDGRAPDEGLNVSAFPGWWYHPGWCLSRSSSGGAVVFWRDRLVLPWPPANRPIDGSSPSRPTRTQRFAPLDARAVFTSRAIRIHSRIKPEMTMLNVNAVVMMIRG